MFPIPKNIVDVSRLKEPKSHEEWLSNNTDKNLIFFQDFRKEDTELIKMFRIPCICVCVYSCASVKLCAHICVCMCMYAYGQEAWCSLSKAQCQCTLPQLGHQKRQHMCTVWERGVGYNSKQDLSWRVEEGDYGLWTCSAAISRHLSLPSSPELLAIWKQMAWVYTICSLSCHSRLSPAHLPISGDFSTPLTVSLSCYSHRYSQELECPASVSCLIASYRYL